MAIPDFQTLMLPILRNAADSNEHTSAELREVLEIQFELTQQEKEEPLPSGRQARFANRVAWATHYLQQARLLDSPRRGVHRITDRGRDALEKARSRIDIAFLEQFPEFLEFRSKNSAKVEKPSVMAPASVDGSDTPEEAIEAAHLSMRKCSR